MLGLYDSIQYYYSSTKPLEADFGKALGRYYHFFFPEAETLEVVTFISEFGNKAILYPGGIELA
ncbi:MAG: hypothetical protein R2728_07500 [Chitinophagales bacterium]